MRTARFVRTLTDEVSCRTPYFHLSLVSGAKVVIIIHPHNRLKIAFAITNVKSALPLLSAYHPLPPIEDKACQ